MIIYNRLTVSVYMYRQTLTQAYSICVGTTLYILGI